MSYKQVTLLTGQSLYDVSIQEYGHTDGIWMILEDNPTIASDLSSVPTPGSKITIRQKMAKKTTHIVSSGVAATTTVNHYATFGYWQNGYSITK
jgi:hypothetical protein